MREQPHEVVEAVTVDEWRCQQAEFDQLLQGILGLFRAQPGEHCRQRRAELSCGRQRQQTEGPPGDGGKLLVRKGEGGAHVDVTGRQGVQAPFLVLQLAGELPGRPLRPAQQPVAGQAQRQRQVAAQPRNVPQRLGIGLRESVAHDGVQQPYGVVGRRVRERQAVDPVKSGQRTATGDQGQGRPVARE